MVVAAKFASNSTAVSEATVEDKPAASLAGSVADKRVIDSDCWRVTVRNVAETFADTPRWRHLEVRIFDTATDTVVARVPEGRQVVVRKAMDKPGITGDSAAMEWGVIARYISVGLRNRGCCKDCFLSTMRLDKIRHPLSARSELSRAGTVGNVPPVALVAIPERN